MRTSKAPPQPSGESGLPLLRRLWRYQLERFPLHQHGPLVAVFSYSALCFSKLLRVPENESFSLPGLLPGAVGFTVCLGFFIQLRIADEFKDYEEDLAHRPYRPVQRGLITLRELFSLGVAIALMQMLLAFVLHPGLLWLLTLTWVYFLLMSREFFVRSWLQNRPLLYMVSHMAIMPFIDLFATGCDWVVAGARPGVLGLSLFLASSYFSGFIIELGRKIRSPQDEEAGVNTYSALWGRPVALGAWIGALSVGGLVAAGAAGNIRFFWPVAILELFMVLAGAIVAIMFLSNPKPSAGKRLELLSGLWVLATYSTLGVLPAILRWLG